MDDSVTGMCLVLLFFFCYHRVRLDACCVCTRPYPEPLSKDMHKILIIYIQALNRCERHPLRK